MAAEMFPADVLSARRWGEEGVEVVVAVGVNGGGCGTADAGATPSHERGAFDLIIWEGQSAFVDEESL